ncbi:hypothetical protein BC828DRAFT_389444 [Blastocladiella britannica]|nr:hypothetical protein BC828DRAFT_389444 [Blastocladiella britannica]
MSQSTLIHSGSAAAADGAGAAPPKHGNVHTLHQKLVAGIEYPRSATASYVLPPTILAGVRCFFFTYIFVIGILGLVRWVINKPTTVLDFEYFFLFTHLNWWGLFAYMTLTLLITRKAWASGFQDDAVVSRVTAIVHSLLYTWNCTFHPIVVGVYWWKLSSGFGPQSATGKLVSGSQHGASVVMVLFEVIFGAMYLNPWGIAPVLVILVLYTIWAWIFFFIGDDWVYSFLDYRGSAAKYMYPAVLVGTVIMFFLMIGVHKLRGALYGKRSLRVPAVASPTVEIPMSQV